MGRIGDDGGIDHYLSYLASRHVIARPVVRQVAGRHARLTGPAARVAADQTQVVCRLHVGIEGVARAHVLEVRAAGSVDGEVEGEHHDLSHLPPGGEVVWSEARYAGVAGRVGVVAGHHAVAVHPLDVAVEPVVRTDVRKVHDAIGGGGCRRVGIGGRVGIGRGVGRGVRGDRCVGVSGRVGRRIGRGVRGAWCARAGVGASGRVS